MKTVRNKLIYHANVREDNGQKIYTVLYKDAASDYYEREIKEWVGVLSYEKLFMNKEGSFPGGYILYSGTGLKQSGYKHLSSQNRNTAHLYGLCRIRP